MTIQEKYGFKKVLNTRGPATIFGAAKVPDEIRRDIYDILGESVEIRDLQALVSKAVQKLTGAEAGCAVHCTSAGMTIATAAALAGDDPAKIKALPDITWNKKKVIIQKGQVTGAGDCPVWQVIKICGAQYVEIGEALDCASFHLQSALDENTAAAFYIMEDTFAPNLLPLETFVKICHEKKVPVICDAAYLTDFRMLAELQVDLAIYSGHKWLGGCTSGIIAGRKDLVHACYLQEMGIGRPMKVGKEGLISVLSAIDYWLNRDVQAIRKSQTAIAEELIKEVKDIPGVTCRMTESLYSPSVRVTMDIDEKQTGISAQTINDDMALQNPVIITDDYYINQGRFMFDMAYLDPGDGAAIGRIIREYISGERIPRESGRKVPRPRQDVLYEWFNGWMEER